MPTASRFARLPRLLPLVVVLALPVAARADEAAAGGEAAASSATTAPATERAPGSGRPDRSGRAWWAPLPDRGWLGVRLGSRAQLEQALQMDSLPAEWSGIVNSRWLLEEWDGKGALVSEVFHDTPAEKAGLLPGDVVVAFNGIRTGSGGELSFVVQRAVRGHDGEIEVLRDGDTRRLLVEIGLHPEDARRMDEEAAAKRAEAPPSSPEAAPAGAPPER